MNVCDPTTQREMCFKQCWYTPFLAVQLVASMGCYFVCSFSVEQVGVQSVQLFKNVYMYVPPYLR